MSRVINLFSDYSLRESLDNIGGKASNHVNSIDESQFMESTDESLIAHVYSQYEVTPITLYEDRMTVDQHEVEADVSHDFRRAGGRRGQRVVVPGTRFIVEVPYVGDAKLWQCAPSTRSMAPPRAVVSSSADGGGFIKIIVEEPTDSLGDGERIKKDIDKTIQDIRVHLGRLNPELEKYNQNNHARIENAVKARRERLGQNRTVLAGLNIPIKRRDGAPSFEPLPIRQKDVKPLQTVTAKPAEIGIASEVYEHILKVIRHVGRTFETTKGTYKKLGEEELRDVVLSNLNGHYEGAATGETFRNNGKTDIRIEDQSRAAFVAECKVWTGQQGVVDALDQLLGYLTWRDCKASIVFFNKNVKGFSGLGQKLESALREHPNFEAKLECHETGEWRFRFHTDEDDEHKVEIHVFLINVFSNESPEDQQ